MSTRKKILSLTVEECEALCQEHSSYSAAAASLGNSTYRTLLSAHMRKLGVDQWQMASKGRDRLGTLRGSKVEQLGKLSSEELRELVSGVSNWTFLLEKFDLTPRYLARLRNLLKEKGVSFTPAPSRTAGNAKWTEENIRRLEKEIFCKNSVVEGATLRGIVRRFNKIFKWFEYRCQLCGLGPEWNGKDLVLQIDHKNGDKYDHRFENLRYLCPNCHSQTETYGSKNRKRRKKS